MLKKIVVLFVVVALALTSSVYADNNNNAIKVFIDGEQLSFAEQPFIDNGVTLVQFRPVFEKLGLKIEWDEATKTINGTKSDLVIKLAIGSTSAVVNDQTIQLEVAPKIINENTVVPLRFVGEASQKTVHWDGDTRTVTIKSDLPPNAKPDGNFAQEAPVIKEISNNATKRVIDGIRNNKFKLNSTEAIMYIDLASYDDAFQFRKLSEQGKKKLINSFVQNNWGGVLGVSTCYVFVSIAKRPLAFTKTSYKNDDNNLTIKEYDTDIFAETLAVNVDDLSPKDETAVTGPSSKITESGKSQEKNVRNSYWGMSAAQLKKAETGKFIGEKNSTLFYSDTISGKSYYITYHFINDQLVRAYFILNEKHSNSNDYIDDYNSLRDSLTAKYGKPNTESQIWEDDLFKNDKSKWGVAVSAGHLSFMALWSTESTAIEEVLYGDNFECHLSARYTGKEYLKLIEEENKKQTNDKL